MSLHERLAYALSLVTAEELASRISRSQKQMRRYLAGADIPFSVLTMISVASGVPVDWLASGRSTFPSWEETQEWKNMAYPSENVIGYEYLSSEADEFQVWPPNLERQSFGKAVTGRAPAQPSNQLAEPSQDPLLAGTSTRRSNIFGVLDMDRLGDAYDLAIAMFRAKGRTPRNSRDLMMITALIYDDFLGPGARAEGLLDLLQDPK